MLDAEVKMFSCLGEEAYRHREYAIYMDELEERLLHTAYLSYPHLMLLQTCVKYTFFIVICLPSVHGVTPAAKPPGRGMGKSRPGTALRSKIRSKLGQLMKFWRDTE